VDIGESVRTLGHGVVWSVFALAVSSALGSDRGSELSRRKVRRKFVGVVLATGWVVPKGWERYSQRRALAHERQRIAKATAGHRPCCWAKGSGGQPMSPLTENSEAPGMSPVEFATAVATYLREEKSAVETTLDQVCPVVELFGSFVERSLGVPLIEAVEAWHAQAFTESRQTDGSPATYGTRRARRMALRMAFRAGRALGLVRGDPTLDVDIGEPNSVSARPLTNVEVDLGHSYALPSLRDLRRSIAWALAESTARTSEMGKVCARDVDVTYGRIWLPGSAAVEPRWGDLTEWGLSQVMRRLEVASDPCDSLIVWRTEPKNLRAASSQAVIETLKAAGLHGPAVRPRSIVAWAGRSLLDVGAPIDEVARRLGVRSLDQAAELIGLDWRAEEHT
jgi:hypothetical protein